MDFFYGNMVRGIRGFSACWERKALELVIVTIYSHNMTRRDNLLARAINNPKGLSFAELQTLLRQAGWTLDHQKGSHQIWYSPKGRRFAIQQAESGTAKGYQVEQFLVQYEVEHEET